MIKKFISGLIITILLFLFVVPTIYSKDKAKKMALGCEMYGMDLLGGGLPTIDMRYWLTEQIGLQANFSYASTSAESGRESPFDATERQFFMMAKFLYNISEGEKVNLNLVFGLGFNFLSNIGNVDDYGRTDTILKLGFSPEVLIFDNFSVEVFAGLSSVFYGESKFDGEGAEDGYSVLSISGTPILSMLGLGFHYYF